MILACKGINVLMFQNVMKKFCIADDWGGFSTFFFICTTILIAAIFPIPGAFCRSVDVRFKLLFSLMKLSIKKYERKHCFCVYWSNNRKTRLGHELCISVSCQRIIKTNCSKKKKKLARSQLRILLQQALTSLSQWSSLHSDNHTNQSSWFHMMSKLNSLKVEFMMNNIKCLLTGSHPT